MGFRVRGLKVYDLEFRVESVRVTILGSTFYVRRLGFRVSGSGFRVKGLGFRV